MTHNVNSVHNPQRDERDEQEEPVNNLELAPSEARLVHKPNRLWLVASRNGFYARDYQWKFKKIVLLWCKPQHVQRGLNDGLMDLPLPKQASHGPISQKWALQMYRARFSLTETRHGLTKHKKYTKKHAAPVVVCLS